MTFTLAEPSKSTLKKGDIVGCSSFSDSEDQEIAFVIREVLKNGYIDVVCIDLSEAHDDVIFLCGSLSVNEVSLMDPSKYNQIGYLTKTLRTAIMEDKDIFTYPFSIKLAKKNRGIEYPYSKVF